VQVVRCDEGDQTGIELSKQGSASKALMRVYGPEFTKETKSKATVVFTSDLIYKYTKVESAYSKRRVSSLGMYQKVLGKMTRR
jgi:hypothetical protein